MSSRSRRLPTSPSERDSLDPEVREIEPMANRRVTNDPEHDGQARNLDAAISVPSELILSYVQWAPNIHNATY